MSDSPLPRPLGTPTKLTLADGREITVRRVQNGDFALLMQAIPAFQSMGSLANLAQGDGAGSYTGPSVEQMELVYQIEARLTGLSVEEVKALEFEDGVALLEAVSSSIPKFKSRRTS